MFFVCQVNFKLILIIDQFDFDINIIDLTFDSSIVTVVNFVLFFSFFHHNHHYHYQVLHTYSIFTKQSSINEQLVIINIIIIFWFNVISIIIFTYISNISVSLSTSMCLFVCMFCNKQKTNYFFFGNLIIGLIYG